MMMTQKPGNSVGIVSMGVAVPEEIRRNDWWPETFRREHAERAKTDLVTRADQASAADVDPEVIRHAAAYRQDVFRGTRERRVIAETEQSSDLEVRAGAKALAGAGFHPRDVDLLLLYSVTPDAPAPFNDAPVAARLGMRRDATTMTVATGCASFVTQLSVAARLLETGAYRTALLIQSAVMSRMADFRAPSSVNCGDGAVATVLSRVDEGLGFVGAHQDTRGDLANGIKIVPHDLPEVPWYRGDLHQQRLTVQSVNPEAAHTMGTRCATFCRETCSRLLADSGYTSSDVDFFCVSQPTAWFGRACCDALGIAHDRTRDTFEQYAHLMAASAPINLWSAHAAGKLDRNDLVLLYSPGAGFIQAAALLRWSLPRRR